MLSMSHLSDKEITVSEEALLSQDMRLLHLHI